MNVVELKRPGEAATDRLRELSRPRPEIFAFFLALDWAAIAAGVMLFYHFRSVWAFLAGSVLVGFGQHGLVVLGHEAVHYRVCSSKRWNDFVGNFFCFLPIGLTLSCYRAFHFPHHKAPFAEQDPELPLRQALGPTFAPPFGVGRGLKLWALSFLGLSFKELITFSNVLPRSSRRDQVLLVAFWAAALAVAYPFSLGLLALWAYGLGTTYISKVRIQGWYEHGLEGMHTNRYALPNPLFRLLMPHNIWVHYEHHKYPGVPFYNLEKVRELEPEPRVYQLHEMVRGLEQESRFYLKKAA